MDETYETSGLTYVKTIDYSQDYWIYGLEPTNKDVVFIAETFYYSARTLDGIIQYIKGQYLDEPLSTGLLPIPEQYPGHTDRKHDYNRNPQPLQEWIDNLPT